MRPNFCFVSSTTAAISAGLSTSSFERQRVRLMPGDEVGDLGRIARGRGDAVAARDQELDASSRPKPVEQPVMSQTGFVVLRSSASPRLREVGAAGDRFDGGDLVAHRLDLGPHALEGDAAERQPERRLLLLDGGDDRLGGADRVARLRAAVALNCVAAGDGRLCVGLDRLLRRS